MSDNMGAAPSTGPFGGPVRPSPVDFATLRAERNSAHVERLAKFAAEHDVDPASIRTHFNPDACFCACPDGPCEHDWQGWHEFADGLGGEQVCARCGQGAMSHSVRVGP